MTSKQLLIYRIVTMSKKFDISQGVTFEQIMSSLCVETIAGDPTPHMNEDDAKKDLAELVETGRIFFEKERYFI